jgi:small subunit ribosomal protein S13
MKRSFVNKKYKKSFVLFGVRLPFNKFLILALTAVYGIGFSSAKKFCAELGISPNVKVQELEESLEHSLVRKIKENLRVENTLKDYVKSNIKAYIDKDCLRGFKHRHKLPVRGQRTHSNAKTVKRLGFKKNIKKKR